jgi:glutamate formiminotransferase
MIECVPNFSEGRDKAVVRAIVDAICSASGVRVLGWELDPDHHRSVVTFIGDPDDVLEGAIRGVGKAADLIDLRKHQGVHPRVGAADVVPFIPLDGSGMADCVAIAHRAGRAIWERFGVPVYHYEAAALRPERKPLQNVRRERFDGHPPDVGDLASHPTAGATMVGARDFLVAFNVRLKTADVGVARAIARKIRQSSGGFPGVRAMGLYLSSRRRAQVSMNLVNAPLEEVYKAIASEAEVEASELIGFVPRRIYQSAPEFFERAENFSTDRILPG